MLILTIRTDKPEAEIGLYEDGRQLAYETWQAHRELGQTLHVKLAGLLQSAGKGWPDVRGIVGYKGPGSFTGLRIGLTVANGLAYAQGCPIVGATGDNWQADGIDRLLRGESEQIALPEYGGEAHITQPRK
jgi:tRNA threonylcarbamoyladenosine biosynthesis protein TsaB